MYTTAASLQDNHVGDIPSPRCSRSVVDDLAVRGISMIAGDLSELLRLTRELGEIEPHPDSGSDGTTTITRDDGRAVLPGHAGFTADGLAPHTDRSDAAEPPPILAMVCGARAARGGKCVVVDGQAVQADLARSAPDVLRALSVPRSVLFGPGEGFPAAVFEPLGGGRTGIRLRLDNAIRFGPESERSVPQLRACIERHSAVFDLRPGQGYVLDNRRWLHGRHAYTGERRMHRVHVRPFAHWKLPIGFVAEVAA